MIPLNIVVTGGNNGIGYETVKALYKKGHNVIFGSRNQQKSEECVETLKKEIGTDKGMLRAFKLDLSLRASVEKFANNVKKNLSHIDILINNSGLLVNERKISELGIDLTMTVNHCGHFYLTYLLFDLMRSVKEGRIINVASKAHTMYKGKDILGDI